MSDEEESWQISFKSWPKKLCSLGPWFVSGWKGWFTLFAMFAPFLGEFVFPISERWVQIYGLAIQILGFWFALYGVNSNLKELELPPIGRRIWAYLRSMPVLPTVRTRSFRAAPGTGTSIGQGFAPSVSVGELSVEDRLKQLEERHKEVSKKLHYLESKQEDDRKQILSEMRKVQRESNLAIDNLKTKVKKVYDDGVALEVFGILLFIIGAIYATIPGTMLSIIKSMLSIIN